jgi:hypothetical protein
MTIARYASPSSHTNALSPRLALTSAWSKRVRAPAVAAAARWAMTLAGSRDV